MLYDVFFIITLFDLLFPLSFALVHIFKFVVFIIYILSMLFNYSFYILHYELSPNIITKVNWCSKQIKQKVGTKKKKKKKIRIVCSQRTHSLYLCIYPIKLSYVPRIIKLDNTILQSNFVFFVGSWSLRTSTAGPSNLWKPLFPNVTTFNGFVAFTVACLGES